MKNIVTLFSILTILFSTTDPAIAQQDFSHPQFAMKQDQDGQSGDDQVFKLYGNYPNPVREQTNFKFEVYEQSKVQIVLYDLLGNKKRVVTNDIFEPGLHRVKMEVSGLEAGIYFYKIHVAEKTLTKRLNIVNN